MSKIRILLADDHQLFRKGLINTLNEAPDIVGVGEASDGYGLLQMVERGIACDLLLLDMNMPNLNGLGTMTKIKRRGINIPVLMLSMEDNESTIIHLLKLGVKGYVLKDASPDELKNAIRTTAGGNHFLNGVLSPFFQKAIDGKKVEEVISVGNLTDYELAFLTLSATEMTYKEIAAEMGKSSRTIDGYRDGLFVKLEAKSRVGLVLFAIKKGLVKL